MDEFLLLTPGPVHIPPEVVAAGSQPMTHHNAPQFQAIFKPLLKNLKLIFGNDGPILIQNSSARGAMEASLTNLFSLGDAVAIIVNGRFGLRFADIARDMGLVVHGVCPTPGHTAKEEAIADTLARNPEIRGLIGCMCETDTGVINDVAMIGRLGARFGILTVVDAVSSAAGMPIRMKEQNIDVCFSGIQKCFMCPPGLAIVATNEKAWEAIHASKHYRHYFNWVKMRKFIEHANAEMMGTPPESLIRSLARAVELMLQEGLENVYARHTLMANAFRAFADVLGCEQAAYDPGYRSDTVTAMILPNGMSASEVVKRALKNDNVLLSTGKDALKERAIRMAHMGPVYPHMMMRGVRALARALTEFGMDAKRVQAALDACALALEHGAVKKAAAIGR